MNTISLAGGCFRGTQKLFDQFDGVVQTEAVVLSRSRKTEKLGGMHIPAAEPVA